MEICSICKRKFKKEEDYLNHECVTGFTPKDFDHQVTLNPEYSKISEEALKRGQSNSEKIEETVQSE